MKLLVQLPNPQSFRRLPQKRPDQWLWGDRSLQFTNLDGQPSSLVRLVSAIEDPFTDREVALIISPQKGKNTNAKVVGRIDFRLFPADVEGIPAVMEREIFPGKFGYSKAPCLWNADFGAESSNKDALRVMYSFYPKDWAQALRSLSLI